MMKNANVNATIARDLVSNAGSSKVGDMNDFAKQRSATDEFQHGKTILNNRSGLDTESRQVEEDLRSLRSEYDYGSKKKFVDVLGNVSATAKLNRLRAQHEIVNAGGNNESGLYSYKSYNSKISKMSRKSKASIGAKVVKAQTAVADPIPEEDIDGAFDEELEAKPEDFVSCNSCLRKLTEDEKIINARFVNEAMAASKDISVFPICIACNFE